MFVVVVYSYSGASFYGNKTANQNDRVGLKDNTVLCFSCRRRHSMAVVLVS